MGLITSPWLIKRLSRIWRPSMARPAGSFPVDQEALNYLRLTGRSEEEIDLVEAYTRRQGMFRDAETPKADFNNVITLNLDSIVASIAGPKRPQDRIALSDAKHEIRSALTEVRQGKEKRVCDHLCKWSGRRIVRPIGCDCRNYQLYEHV